MWNVYCLDIKKTHVEEMAHDRLLKAAREYQETLTEDEAKEKVLQIMKTSQKKSFIKVCEDTNLPKYFIYERLPGSKNIWVKLCIVEDEKRKIRMIKTLWTDSEARTPKPEKRSRRKRFDA